MPKIHPSQQIDFESFKLKSKSAAVLIVKLTSLGVVSGLMAAEKLTGVPVMTVFQEITKTIEGHAKNLADNEEMA